MLESTKLTNLQDFVSTYVPGSGQHPVVLVVVVVDATVVVLFVVAFAVVELAVVVLVGVGLVFAALAFETVAAADRFVGCFLHVQFPFHPTLLAGPQFWFHTHSLEWGGQHWQWEVGLSLRS